MRAQGVVSGVCAATVPSLALHAAASTDRLHILTCLVQACIHRRLADQINGNSVEWRLEAAVGVVLGTYSTTARILVPSEAQRASPGVLSAPYGHRFWCCEVGV